MRGLPALAAALLALCWAGSAQAATPPLLWQTPEDGKAGAGAGQFQGAVDIDVDQSTGHLFIADRGNARLVELDAWGGFVKAWGWGVVASGPGNQPPKDEHQQLTVSATSGTYKLRYFNAFGGGSVGQNTTAIPFDAPAATVQAALENLESLEPGDVSVSGGPGNATGSAPYSIEFEGPYADADIPQLRMFESTLAGGAASATVQTLQGGSSFEVCVPENGDVCQEGQRGGGAPGQLAGPYGVVVDAAGDIYVHELVTNDSTVSGEANFRVQKFDPSGDLLWLAGGEVNKTKSAEVGSSEAERNLCTKAQLEGGDVCGRGVPGAGKGQFAQTNFTGSKIALGTAGTIFVGDVERIQELSTAGAYLGEVAVPGEVIRSLEIDSAGSFFAVYAENGGVSKNNVRKLDAAGTQVATRAVADPKALELNDAGELYVVAGLGGLVDDRIVKFDAAGNQLIAPEEEFGKAQSIGGLAASGACGIPGEDLYVGANPVTGSSSIRAYGPAPQDTVACPLPQLAPTINDSFAASVGSDSATLAAEINPNFWPDTRYRVEYGTGKCSEGGCTSSQPLPPGSLLTDQIVKASLKTAGVFLSGLAPDTTYHYRFVAQSGGGSSVSEEGTFKTMALRPPLLDPDPCPNAAFREGSAAALPDCRAYEMVSPVDKNGGDILTFLTGGRDRAALDQASLDGERLTYSSYRSFGDAESAPFTSTYLAGRVAGEGWSSQGISPPRGQSLFDAISLIHSQFMAFSPDLCSGWFLHDAKPALTPSAPEGFANLYRRENCGAGEGSYEELIGLAPPNLAPEAFTSEVQGLSVDGTHVIFRSGDQLTPNATPCAGPSFIPPCIQLFEAHGEGQLRLVCILPGGAPVSEGCSAGTRSNNFNEGRSHAVRNAISEDGSRIFWSDIFEGQGQIYVRIDGSETLPVSEAGEALSGKAGVGAQYWTAAADGSSAIFSVGNFAAGDADLYRFDVDTEETTKVVGEFYGLLGASEDAERLYLVSGEALDGAAVAGEPNLYLREVGGGTSFIATLSKRDVLQGGGLGDISVVNYRPSFHLAQVSADGLHAAFMSTASLTGTDSTDASSGEADAHVFRYGVGEGLACVSCNPTGARPAGRNIIEEGDGAPYWAAAKIPTAETQLYDTPRVLSSNGARLYFESFEALVPADTNGKLDVYQWEALGEGPPEASCKESSPSFSEGANGCVDLISSGESAEDSAIVDVDADGTDVFIATYESLLPQDPGLLDVYDVRVGGGLPTPPTPEPFCEGEACQSPPAPPAEVTPSSSTFRGPGDPVAQPPRKRRCPKGKRKVRRAGKTRCVGRRPAPKRAKTRRGRISD